MSRLLAVIFLLLFATILGCLGSGTPASEPTTPDLQYTVLPIQYAAGPFNVSALWCEPIGANSATPGIVLTGGDGVTLDKLRPACEAFAKKGLVALAHDNVNGSMGDNVEAVAAGAKKLRANAPTRPITLWAHSSGTIFSFFAAYELEVRGITISAFIDTSGHMQLPICDNRGEQTAELNGQVSPCLAYLNEFPSPVLVVHGLNDTVVAPEFAYAFTARLQADGIEHEQAYVLDAKHEFMLDHDWVLEKEAAFVKAHAK